MRATVLGECVVRPVDLDPATATAIATTRAHITARTAMAWGEHCSECALPACYRTCALYRPRGDLKCRRFANGLENVRPRQGAAPRGPFLRLSFLKWGKFETDGRPRLLPPLRVRAVELVDRAMRAAIDAVPGFFDPRREAARLWDRWKPELIERGGDLAESDGFLLEVINTGSRTLPLTLTIRHKSAEDPRFFQLRMILPPGHSRQFAPIADIAARIDLAAKLLFQIEPATDETTPDLIVTLADFVRLDAGGRRLAGIGTAEDTGPARKAKCLVWDLDETLWSGTLAEDGIEGLRLDETARRAIIELDRRGILHSIASKNDPALAMRALRHFRLDDYFLCPQISWGPKSEAMTAIAAALNIGLDSLVFIDDQPFERAEAADAHPRLRTLPASEIAALVDHPWFDVPETEEGRHRRQMYRAEQHRRAALATDRRDIVSFLRRCEIEIDVATLSAATLPRAFELVQRTNQLNTSGNRLSRSDLQRIARRDGGSIGLLVHCRDRFGDYGIIAFAHIDADAATVRDFCMSCRVQNKKVENAIFEMLRRHFARAGGERLRIPCRKTSRNEPIRASLRAMGFAPEHETTGGIVFSARLRRPIPDADIVTLRGEPEDFLALPARNR